MDLRELQDMDAEDIKRMEMDKHLEKMRGGRNMFDPMKELQEQFAKEEEKLQKEIEQNPLSMYSTSELKRELRRRKGKLK